MTDIRLSDFEKSASIDFVKLIAPRDAALDIDANRLYRKHLRAEGHEGVQFTIHDAGAGDLQEIAKKLPDAVVNGLEVSVDFKPKRSPRGEDLRLQLDTVRQWLLSHHYPWGGSGLQYTARTSRAKAQFDVLEEGDSYRRPHFGETFYLGHSKGLYADHAKPNYASMRMYVKITDSGSALQPKDWVMRMEVTLNRKGCTHFGVSTITDLLLFNFRHLGAYFRLVRPRPRGGNLGLWRLLRANRPLGQLVVSRRQADVARIHRDAGAYALHGHLDAEIHSHRNHAVGNRAIRAELDNLTRRIAQV